MKVLRSRALLIPLALAEIFCAWACFSFRVSFYFIDAAAFTGATTLVFSLLVLNALLALVLLPLGSKLSDKCYKGLIITNIVLFIVAVAVVAAFSVMGLEMMGDYLFYFREAAPFVLAMCAVATLVFVAPSFKGGAKTAIAVATAVATVLSCVGLYFDVTPFKLTSEPVVFINSADTYSVVWATSHPSTGTLTYTNAQGEHTVVETTAGNKNCSSSIHHITVNRSEFDGAQYSVNSRHVIERTGYSVFYGKSVTSDTYTLTVPGEDREELNIYSFSDWHEHQQYAEEVGDHLRRMEIPDLVVMLGDSVNMVNSESQVAKSILAPCARLSQSSVPVVYVRGNHELRGPAMEQLGTMLGYPSFYYSFDFSFLSTIVLDRGENHEDDFVEYWGLADYENYRKEQLQWLENQQYTKGKFNLNLVHDSAMADYCGDKLEQMGTDLSVSGHLHKCVTLKKGQSYEEEDMTASHFPVIIDGGKGTSDYTGSLLKITRDKHATVQFVDRNGTATDPIELM